jgi:hypothetical protein
MNFKLKTAAAVILAASLAVSFAYAGEGKSPAKKHAATKKAKTPPPPSVQEQIQALRHELESQASQIDSLKSGLAEKDARLKKAELAAAEAQAAADKANAAASIQQQAVKENESAVSTLQTSVTDLKGSEAKLATTVTTTTEKIQKQIDSPDGIHYKGVTITPGGYMQFATIFRARNANSDTADNYGQYAFGNSPDYYQSEFRASGRASRLSVKAQGAANGMKFMAYTEIDFLAAAGGTETQTNSFSPRLRLAFANVDLPSGWSIAGGQNWSLLQTTRKGIDPLSEWVPSIIDNSYTPGFTYARQGGIRAVKQLTPQLWFGISLENSDTVATGGCTSASVCSFALGNIQGLANSMSTTSPNNGYLNATSGADTITGNPSTNKAPDMVAKFAYEPGWGHYEVKLMSRWFRDRVYPNYFSVTPDSATYSSTVAGNTADARNITTTGGGIGVSAILPIVKKKLDLDFQTLIGDGIGRYGTASGPDVTFNPKGALVPVKAAQAILGIETHPTPKFDFNLYGGGEYYKRVQYFIPKGSNFFGETTTANAEAGYGYQDANDTGCSIEGTYVTTTTSSVPALSTKCSGNTKSLWALQPQLWYRIHKGKEGTVQFGASYAYVYREAWSGLGPSSTTTAATLPTVNGLVTPKTINQIVMTSFRYYLP